MLLDDGAIHCQRIDELCGVEAGGSEGEFLVTELLTPSEKMKTTVGNRSLSNKTSKIMHYRLLSACTTTLSCVCCGCRLKTVSERACEKDKH